MPRNPRNSQNEVLLGMLRDARAERGVTQTAIAEALGLRQTDVSKVERGVRRLDILELRDWLAAMEMGLAEFAIDLDQRLAGIEALHRQVKMRR